MPFTVRAAIDLMWLATGLIWIAAAFTSKRTVKKQPLGGRLIHIGILILAFALVFQTHYWDWAPPLHWRFVPDSAALSWAALILTFAGLAFAIWARFYIGKNWSGTVTLKQDHELIRSGPYAVVRHPIYSGLALALLGAAIVSGELRGLIGTAIIVIEFKRKSLLEERFMLEHFGSQYQDYRRQVKALIPGLW